jgi:hypothetical protein
MQNAVDSELRRIYGDGFRSLFLLLTAYFHQDARTAASRGSRMVTTVPF